eukprot:10225738-Lingulodinium_polyedra.AAC.1
MCISNSMRRHRATTCDNLQHTTTSCNNSMQQPRATTTTIACATITYNSAAKHRSNSHTATTRPPNSHILQHQHSHRAAANRI